MKKQIITQIEDYEPMVGAETIECIMKKAKTLRNLHVANVNSTYYGGGAELLTSLTLLMNSVGIKTGWRVIQGAPDFFSITKKMHNALQRKAAVVLQKSIREGFGLTVSEAMWKGTPVIGGNVGGIRYQIDDGKNGFLVSSIEEAAKRIVQVVKNKKVGKRLGKNAKEKVRKHFLLTRYLEQYLDFFNSFETIYRLRH